MKKGILVVSFGTTYEEARKKSIENVEKTIQKAFPEYEVRRAFTSNIIIKRLKARDNLHIDQPLEALEKMVEEGICEIHVQPLHIIHGFEYEKVQKAVRVIQHRKDVKITIGKPLLSQESHYEEVIKAIEPKLKAEENHGYVLMGHGTKHHANACYSMLQAKLNDCRTDVHIANVEGYPELDHIMPRLEKYEKITVLPFMIVAGNHARNDMVDNEDSYKNQLQKLGKKVEAKIEGLGEIEAICQSFVNRIKEEM